MPAEERDRVKELFGKESDLNTRYQENLANHDEKIRVTRADLKGMPDKFIAGLERAEGTEAGEEVLLLTLKYPHMIPIMQSCEVAETRRRMFMTKGTMCPENLELLADAVRVRHELAAELGFPAYSDYVLRGRMAETATTVAEFLDDLAGRLKPLAAEDLKIVTARKRQDVGDDDGKEAELRGWDLTYYSTLLAKERYGLDPVSVLVALPCLAVESVCAYTCACERAQGRAVFLSHARPQCPPLLPTLFRIVLCTGGDQAVLPAGPCDQGNVGNLRGLAGFEVRRGY